MKTNTATIRALMEANGSAFMTVTFTKKNGEVRTINGRAGVKKHLAGGVRTTDASEYFMIYENNVGYRAVNYATVSEIKMQGKVFTISQAE